MDPDQPAHPRSLIRIHAVRLPTHLQEEKLVANSMDIDQIARMRRLVWIHAGRKPIMLVLSLRAHICKHIFVSFVFKNAFLYPSSTRRVFYFHKIFVLRFIQIHVQINWYNAFLSFLFIDCEEQYNK
jgi:hypothetical protein